MTIVSGRNLRENCKPIKVLITGTSGYVGGNLFRTLEAKGFDVYGVTSKSVYDGKHFSIDITNPASVAKIVQLIKPDFVVHAAGISSLTVCEKNPFLAMQVNVESTKNFIDAIKSTDKNTKLIFLSSDYVFDGNCGNYKENDCVNPQTVYGKTKVLSEAHIREKLQKYVICRTSNVYGRGGNFFKFIVDNLEENRSIDIYNDAYFTPTYIDYLLDSLIRLIDLDFSGIIHIAGGKRLSRYEFAKMIAEITGKDLSLIKPVSAKGQLIAKDNSLNSDLAKTVLHNCPPDIDSSLLYSLGYLVPPYFSFADIRGKLIGIFQGFRWEEINFIESIHGSVRGNHYHKNTMEGIFIVAGRIRITIVNIPTGKKRSFEAKKGDALLINPNEVHTFEVLEDSCWINMLSTSLDDHNKDIHRLPK